MCLVLDLFSAGADTSTNSIGFAILYLINYPQVQAKVQAELDEVCGDKLPTLAHRSKYLTKSSHIKTPFEFNYNHLKQSAIHGGVFNGSPATCDDCTNLAASGRH